ncbi:MAG: aminoglycoside phosphotransferase family protein [Rhodobacteraceae bacterium]|nr:MAG: aminoglycoside phosphotransferase family protein [Paracoccaceae bacterium]
MSCAADLPPKGLRDLVAQRVTAPVCWVRLPGGRTNRSWRVRGATCDWVVKLFDASRSNRLFPNDPQAERQALIALAGQGLGPDFVAEFELQGEVGLIYDYVEGALSGKTDHRTIRALGRLHHLTPPLELRQIDVCPVVLLEQGRSFLRGLDTPLVRHLIATEPAPSPVPGGREVFLHGDPVPANVLIHDGRLRFIDWQCPARGDATADLAIALSPAMHHVYGRGIFAKAEQETALAAYPEADTIARYRQLAPFYRWRMAAYCAWKAARGEAIYEVAAEAELNPERA